MLEVVDKVGIQLVLYFKVSVSCFVTKMLSDIFAFLAVNDDNSTRDNGFGFTGTAHEGHCELLAKV